jgi:ABC-type antimicrobial peptide transport system permease subunit
MALGAGSPSVMWLILRDALLMVAIGSLVGLPAAFALSRLVGTILYGITPADPASFALATAVLLAVAAFASFLPARRATRIDPIRALRYE